jgi:CheY-specific phosphatase CheX
MAAEIVSRLIPNAFSTMAGMETEITVLNVEDNLASPGRSVAGVIGWMGALSGTGILESSPDFACALANRMLGTNETTLTPDALDAVAEMTNIVFGGMKTELEKRFGSMALSIPTIVDGTDIEMRTSGELVAVLRIVIEEHTVRVRLYMNSSDEKRGPFWTISRTDKP